MGTKFGYKKYMKNEVKKDSSLLKIFIISFFGMLLVFTFLIKSFSPSVDTSIGDYQQESITDITGEQIKNIDGRLSAIQEEDQGRSFSDLMSNPEDISPTEIQNKREDNDFKVVENSSEQNTTVVSNAQQEPIYKVFIGSYTSAEQAKVARDIVQEAGLGLNPIVKCIGSNNYTLQVGIFKSKKSAESLLYTIQQNHLQGRVVQDY